MLKPCSLTFAPKNDNSAAFRRLCVETVTGNGRIPLSVQPPLGGCVLKQNTIAQMAQFNHQPPLGGCVLKHSYLILYASVYVSRL